MAKKTNFGKIDLSKINLDKLKIGSEAINKRLKISKAQQTMLVAVGIAAIMLGVAGVLGVYLFKYVVFNNEVITEKNNSIKAYSNSIKNSGACKKPKGSIYTADELKKCRPNDIDVEEVSGTLRYNVLVDMAANADLESVARNSLSVCNNPSTGEKYTYNDLLEKYQNAKSSSDRTYYLDAIKICSALRVIPDALPMNANNEALLASLNQIFLLSGWVPESLSPSSSSNEESESGLSEIPVNLRIEAGNAKTLTVISNIEKSIREFSVDSAKIEWAGGNQLNVNAKATAYYTGEVTVNETKKTVKANKTAKKGRQ